MNRSHQSNVHLSNDLKELSDVEQIRGSGGAVMQQRPEEALRGAFSGYAAGDLEIAQEVIWGDNSGPVTATTFTASDGSVSGFTFDSESVQRVYVPQKYSNA